MATEVAPTFGGITTALGAFEEDLRGLAMICGRDGRHVHAERMLATARRFERHRAEVTGLEQTLVDELVLEAAPPTPPRLPDWRRPGRPSPKLAAAMADTEFGEVKGAYLTDVLSRSSMAQAVEIAIATGSLYRDLREQPPAGLTDESAGFLRGAASRLPPVMKNISGDAMLLGFHAYEMMESYALDLPTGWSADVIDDRFAAFVGELEEFQFVDKARRVQPQESGVTRAVPDHILRTRPGGGGPTDLGPAGTGGQGFKPR